MKLFFKSIKFSNILSYGASPVTIDISKGLTGIFGDNGTGKSTIQDALCYGLYGKPYRDITIKSLLNRRNKKNLSVTINFSKDNDEFSIIRTMKPDSLTIIKNNTELSSLSAKKLNQEELDKILGIDYDLFKQVLSLSVNSNKPFISLPASKKREIIEQVFNIQIFGKMAEINKEKIKNIKKEIEFGQKNFELINQTLQTLKSKYIEIENAGKNFDINKTNKINELEESIKDKYEELSSITLILNNLKDKVKDFNEGESDSIKKEIYDIEKSVSQYENSIYNNKKLLKNISNGIVDDVNVLTDNNILKLQISDIEIEIGNIDKEINKYSSYVDMVLHSNKGDTIVDYNKKIYELNRSMDILVSQIDMIVNKLNKISNVEGDSKCPECNSLITEDHKQSEINRFKSEIETLKNEYKVKESDKITFEKELESYRRSKAEEFSSKIKELQDQKKANKDKINELNNTINKAIEDYKVTKVSSIEIENDDYTNKITKLNSDKKILNDKLDTINKQQNIFSEIKINEYKITSLNENIIKLNKDLETVKTSKFEIDLSEMKKELQEKYNAMKKIKSDNDKLDSDYDLYLKTADILSDTGIKSYFFENLIPLLNEKINEYLKIFEIPIIINFDKSMEALIYSYSNLQEPIEYMSHSEGEKKRVDMAILLSFISITKLLSNWDCNLLVIDELLDGAIDEKGLEKLVSSLKSICENGHSVYVISHRLRNEFNEYFNHKLFIERRQYGFSTIKAS